MNKILELRNLSLEKLGHPKELGNVDVMNLKFYSLEDNLWLLLGELTSHILLNYASTGKFKFRVWEYRKHIRTVLLVKALLERLWEIIKK